MAWGYFGWVTQASLGQWDMYIFPLLNNVKLFPRVVILIYTPISIHNRYNLFLIFTNSKGWDRERLEAKDSHMFYLMMI